MNKTFVLTFIIRDAEGNIIKRQVRRFKTQVNALLRLDDMVKAGDIDNMMYGADSVLAILRSPEGVHFRELYK